MGLRQESTDYADRLNGHIERIGRNEKKYPDRGLLLKITLRWGKQLTSCWHAIHLFLSGVNTMGIFFFTWAKENNFPNLSDLNIRQLDSPSLSVIRMSVKTSFLVYYRGILYFLDISGKVFFTFPKSQRDLSRSGQPSLSFTKTMFVAI